MIEEPKPVETYAEQVRPEAAAFTKDALGTSAKERKAAVAIEFISSDYMTLLMLAYVLAESLAAGSVDDTATIVERFEDVNTHLDLSDALNLGWKDTLGFSEYLQAQDGEPLDDKMYRLISFTSICTLRKSASVISESLSFCSLGIIWPRNRASSSSTDLRPMSRLYVRYSSAYSLKHFSCRSS